MVWAWMLEDTSPPLFLGGFYLPPLLCFFRWPQEAYSRVGHSTHRGSTSPGWGKEASSFPQAWNLQGLYHT